MDKMWLVYAHLSTVVPALLIGAYVLSARKGTDQHRRLGRAYVILMVTTAAITVFIPAFVGPQVIGHFGVIHILTVMVFITSWRAIQAIKAGKVKAHQRHMIGMYVGAGLLAGMFAMMPGRLIHHWLFG